MKTAQSCLSLCESIDCTVHGILQARIPFPSPGDFPNPGIEPRSPVLQADSLPAELQKKPKNTGVGSLSLLQRIFPNQESNCGLLHCRWILHQLSYQGSISLISLDFILRTVGKYRRFKAGEQPSDLHFKSLLC